MNQVDCLHKVPHDPAFKANLGWASGEPTTTMCPQSIAKMVYNSNNYGLWYLYVLKSNLLLGFINQTYN